MAEAEASAAKLEALIALLSEFAALPAAAVAEAAALDTAADAAAVKLSTCWKLSSSSSHVKGRPRSARLIMVIRWSP
ncbi:MAG: hypothetical protein WBP82_00265 [Leuconostoc mesenteroides]